MAHNDLIFLPLTELAGRIKKRELSPVELTEAYLDRIDQVNDRFRIYITVNHDQARTAARSAEEEIKQGMYRGPLHGIPYTCKDIFLTQNIRTTGGSRVLENWIPEKDAAVIERLKVAGSILLGKANLHEFCDGATGVNPHYGTVLNPWDTSRITGGSSSGSAAAVSFGLAATAVGSDTGGSSRIPAALCGVVGFKPTYGRISCYGLIPYSWSLDHVGLLTRTVADMALFLEAVAGYDPRDPASANVAVPSYVRELSDNVSGLRVGVPREFYFDYVDQEIVDAVRGVLKSLEVLGAKIIEVEFPPMKHSRTVSHLIQLPEILSYHSRYLPKKAHLYGADFRSSLARGQFILAEHYLRAKRMLVYYRRQMADVLKSIDVIVTPTCPIVAPAIGTMKVTTEGKIEPVGTALARLTNFFNMTANPALSLPCGLHSLGLPMGVQLIGGCFDETTLLRVAHTLESHLHWPPRHIWDSENLRNPRTKKVGD